MAAMLKYFQHFFWLSVQNVENIRTFVLIVYQKLRVNVVELFFDRNH